MTDGLNTVRESYRYDAFGLPSVTIGSGQTAIGNRFLFTGREWNPTFGFYEYRARAYNPTIGRFMSEDPKGFDAGDYNLYRYCANDPLDLADPAGEDVNLDMFSFEESKQQSLNLKPLPLQPDRFTVGAHGNPGFVSDARGKRFDYQGHALGAKGLANAMIKSGFQKNMDVVLYSCSTGAGSDCLGQQLANKLHTTVWAPNNVLWARPDGTMFVAPRLNNDPKRDKNGKPTNPDYSKPDPNVRGGFNRFDPIPEKHVDSLIPRIPQANSQ